MSYITTYSGLDFDYLKPVASSICIKDIPSPLKRLLPDYQAIEQRVDIVIRETFGLPAEMSEVVHYCDLVMLATERQELDIDDGKEWPMLAGIPLAEMAIVAMSPRDARIAFMARFNELTGGDVCQR